MLRKPERRKALRVEWHSSARIQLPGVGGSVPCVVHNLSNTGGAHNSVKCADTAGGVHASVIARR